MFPRQRGGRGYSGRAGLPLRVTVRRPRLLHRESHSSLGISGMRCPERRDPHSGSVSPRTLAVEDHAGELHTRTPPSLTGQREQKACRSTVSTRALVADCKLLEQRELVKGWVELVPT